jgi:hypothetical protein
VRLLRSKVYIFRMSFVISGFLGVFVENLRRLNSEFFLEFE